jgi:hypothetical protein
MARHPAQGYNTGCFQKISWGHGSRMQFLGLNLVTRSLTGTCMVNKTSINLGKLKSVIVSLIFSHSLITDTITLFFVCLCFAHKMSRFILCGMRVKEIGSLQ